MNSLPAPLRQVARDLVDKKLWPIAALLLAALVAVPLMIGGSSSSDAPASPAPLGAVAPAGPDSESLITVVDQAVTGKERPGDIEDPIYDPPEPEEAASVTTTTGGTTTGTAPATPAAPAGGPAAPGGPAGPGTSTTTPPAPSVAPEADGVHYRAVVRWYVDDADKPRALSRLTPLGPLEDPVALYLGVTRSQTTNYAVFLLGTHSTSEGDGKCEDDECRVIGLKAGDKRTVSYALESGEVRRYHLEVTSVKTVTADGAEARHMRAKVHPDGRDVMRAMWQNEAVAAALGPVQYDRDSGLLYKVRDAEKAAG